MLGLTQATFPRIEATICILSPFAMLCLLDSQLPEPTFYLLAFYAWPSLYSCMEKCLHSSVLRWILPLCQVQCLFFLPPTWSSPWRYLHSSILQLLYYFLYYCSLQNHSFDWLYTILDCSILCLCVWFMCYPVTWLLKPPTAKTNCFLFYKSFLNLSIYSVNICFLLLKTNRQRPELMF